MALIHVHTTASDGTATPEQIARAARRAGVEVVMLTDHDRLSPGAGWQSGILLLSGLEVTPRRNHLLVMGLDRDMPKMRGDGVNGDPARSLSWAARQGAWSAVAHPLDPPLALWHHSSSYAASDFSALESDALELYNAISAFKRGLAGMYQGLARILMPRTFLPGPHAAALALWDTLGRRRPWTAIGGADAHAFSSGLKWLPLEVYSYRRHMRLVTTGLWLARPLQGQLEPDQETVLEALRRGRAFVALGRARGFSCWLEHPDGRRLLPGEELAFAPGCRLRARLPGWGRLSLLCNGRLEARRVGLGLSHTLQGPGVWRLEARRWRPPAGWRPWIYCNPFYLRDQAEAA